MALLRELRSALKDAVELGLCDHARADTIWLDVRSSRDPDQAAQEWIRELLDAPSGGIVSQGRRSPSQLHRQPAYGQRRSTNAPPQAESRHRSLRRQRSRSPLQRQPAHGQPSPNALSPGDPRRQSFQHRSTPSRLERLEHDCHSESTPAALQLSATNMTAAAPQEAPGTLLAAGVELAAATAATYMGQDSRSSPPALGGHCRGEAGLPRPRRSARSTHSPHVPASHGAAEAPQSSTIAGSIPSREAFSVSHSVNQRRPELSLVATADLVRERLRLPSRSTAPSVDGPESTESTSLAIRWTIDAARVQLGLPRIDESVPLRQAMAELCDIMEIETGWKIQRPRPGVVTKLLSPYGKRKFMTGKCECCCSGHSGHFRSNRCCSRECAPGFEENRMAAFRAEQEAEQGTPHPHAHGQLDPQQQIIMTRRMTGLATPVVQRAIHPRVGLEPVLAEYQVLRRCTVRAGKDVSSTKLGEFRSGTVLAAVEEGETPNGLPLIRTSTLTEGGSKGWVKIISSKNKPFLVKLPVRAEPTLGGDKEEAVSTLPIVPLSHPSLHLNLKAAKSTYLEQQLTPRRAPGAQLAAPFKKAPTPEPEPEPELELEPQLAPREESGASWGQFKKALVSELEPEAEPQLTGQSHAAMQAVNLGSWSDPRLLEAVAQIRWQLELSGDNALVDTIILARRQLGLKIERSPQSSLQGFVQQAIDVCEMLGIETKLREATANGPASTDVDGLD